MSKSRSKADKALYERVVTAEEASRINYKEQLAAKVATTLNVKKEEI